MQKAPEKRTPKSEGPKSATLAGLDGSAYGAKAAAAWIRPRPSLAKRPKKAPTPAESSISITSSQDTAYSPTRARMMNVDPPVNRRQSSPWAMRCPAVPMRHSVGAPNGTLLHPQQHRPRKPMTASPADEGLANSPKSPARMAQGREQTRGAKAQRSETYRRQGLKHFNQQRFDLRCAISNATLTPQRMPRFRPPSTAISPRAITVRTRHSGRSRHTTGYLRSILDIRTGLPCYSKRRCCKQNRATSIRHVRFCGRPRKIRRWPVERSGAECYQQKLAAR